MPKKPLISELSPEDQEKRRAYNREYARGYRKRKHPDLKHRYGITKEERDAILAGQGDVCAICEGVATDVDHCHSTGAVRGILCRSCNTALGSFRDSPQLLMKAAQYLNDRTH